MESVTVVIPSYNRGRLLSEVLPTYLQQNVAEIIVIDDASSDETQGVLFKLSEKWGRLRYFRNEVNRKQTFSKNRGIAETKTKYIYFGDDDSVLMPNSIQYLLETMSQHDADIVGARALYMRDAESIEDCMRRHDVSANCVSDIANIARLWLDPTKKVGCPIAVPMCHASFLIKTDCAKKILFDESYSGNCFREETDFLIRAKYNGASIYFDSRACQINLPRGQTVGGARSGGRLSYEWDSVWNTFYFLRKNRRILRILGMRRSAVVMTVSFIIGRISTFAKKVLA